MSSNLFAFAVQPYDSDAGTSAFVRLTHNGQVGRVSYVGGWMDLYLYPLSWSNRCTLGASKADWERAYPDSERFRLKHVDCETPYAKTACRGVVTGMLSQWIDDLMRQPALDLRVDGSMPYVEPNGSFHFIATVTPRNKHLFRHGQKWRAENPELQFLIPHAWTVSAVRIVSPEVVDVSSDIEMTLGGRHGRVNVPLFDSEGALMIHVVCDVPSVVSGAGSVVRIWTQWDVGDDSRTETKLSLEERVHMHYVDSPVGDVGALIRR